jgi:cytochrome c oxidase subunit II
MWLQADEPGRYRGQCAEFCGLQHAKMIFYVVADPPERFEQWLQDTSEEAARPATDSEREGRAIFLNSTCAGCHAILGTPAEAALGPDLTHIASRETIASGALENTRANLRRWILHPQSVKPGASMPPTDLNEEQVEALLDYLESLR